MDRNILARIEALRRQILVHSCLYYLFDSPIISDKEYDNRARELDRLQREYPEESKQGVFAEAFADFSESVSGFNLPIRDDWVVGTAIYLSRLHEQFKKGGD
ncbi:DNA ligase LigA-related protein [Thermoactinomyces vulgaris]|jgi:NAD-dependent DNA ligase|uniref:DNA ligase LigA-related protein n=1 Tax=Thermoactinomyces vulgaris TaxID=2026 RepID=UPI00362DBBEC